MLLILLPISARLARRCYIHVFAVSFEARARVVDMIFDKADAGLLSRFILFMRKEVAREVDIIGYLWYFGL